MKKFISTALLMCLIISLPLLSLTSVNAQETLDIKITPDGTIEPNTKLLEQNNNVYTFKGDISGTLDIHANNIVIDGAGYTLNGGILLAANHRPSNDPNHPVDYPHTDCCLNVVVKNLKIINGGITSGAGGKNYTFIGNYFENARIRFIGNAGDDVDLFVHNTFVNVTFDFTYGGGSLVVMTENNMVNINVIAFGTYFPKLDRNYYGDYTVRYPYAVQVGNSGVWNTPYVLSIYEPDEPKANTVDSQPLVNPVTGFEVPHFNGPLPSANKPSTNTDTGSSSTGSGTKTQSTNANTESSLSSRVDTKSQLTDADVETNSIASDLSTKQMLDTSYSLGMIALIAGVLAAIAIVPAVIVLVVKKRNK
ncbi:MAG: hypothetical protein FWC33_02900 [Candidatus Bathyarchaeota archaeon]|nr:hypothetical protein [Candidatus Termiticorpusculum sp.]